MGGFVPRVKKTVTYIVCTVLVNERGEVLMIQEAKRSCRGRWYLPAGRMERNETIEVSPATSAICLQFLNYANTSKCIAVRKVATPLRELTCHMGSHSVTCHPAELTFPPLPQPKLVLD